MICDVYAACICSTWSGGARNGKREQVSVIIICETASKQKLIDLSRLSERIASFKGQTRYKNFQENGHRSDQFRTEATRKLSESCLSPLIQVWVLRLEGSIILPGTWIFFALFVIITIGTKIAQVQFSRASSACVLCYARRESSEAIKSDENVVLHL